MGLSEFVIARLLDWARVGIDDNIENSILNGLAYLGLFFVAMWFLLYVIGWGFFSGHWVRNLWIIGIWLVIELANYIGGGHDKKHH